MKLIALNIRQGGGTRIAAIGDYLVAQECDAVVKVQCGWQPAYSHA